MGVPLLLLGDGHYWRCEPFLNAKKLVGYIGLSPSMRNPVTTLKVEKKALEYWQR